MTDSSENTNQIKPEDTDVEMLPSEENKPKEPEGQPIGEHVKQDIVTQLIEMGFSKNVSEKACFFNQSVLESAVNWIYEHQNDPDFEEELRIVHQEENQPKLTEEEVKQKAKELQEYARKRYVQKQKELEEEQERNRVRVSMKKIKINY